MKKLDLNVKLGTPFEKVTRNEESKEGGLTVHLQGGEKIHADKVLLAMGRPPNVRNLDLENTNIVVEKGAIKVDKFQNTTVENVYAIGDVTN